MATKEQLHLYVACHEFAFSIDVRSIERLVLPDEVTVAPGGSAAVQVGRQRYAPFNLGRLLEMPDTRGATVLARTLVAGTEVAFALETGPCLLVRSQERAHRIAAGIFRGRRRALSGAFVLPEGLRAPGRAPVGFILDLDQLLDVAEREAAAKLRTGSDVRTLTHP